MDIDIHAHCSGSDVIKAASPSMQLPSMLLAEMCLGQTSSVQRSHVQTFAAHL